MVRGLWWFPQSKTNMQMVGVQPDSGWMPSRFHSMKQAWKQAEEQQESGHMPQGAPQSEAARKTGRG